MNDDIYTKRPIGDDSGEHILQNALGGRLSVRGLIDSSTNHEFGHTIDHALEQAVHPVRVMLHARSGRGEDPAGMIGLEADGRAFDIAAGGVIRPQPEKPRKLEWVDGRLDLDVTVPDERALRDMLRKEARRQSRDLNEVMAKIRPHMVQRRELPPVFHFNIGVWDTMPYRAIAKGACNLFAHGNADEFRHEAFDEIRAFVLNGTVANVLPVQAAEVDIRHDALGPMDHLVRVGVSESGDLVALVVYFAHFGFVVRLGTAPPGVRVERAYRVDQLGRQHRLDDARDLAIVIPCFHEAAARSYEEFGALVIRQRDTFAPAALEYQEGLWLQRIIRRHARRLECEIGPGNEPTEAQRWAFARAVADDVAADLKPRVVLAVEERMCAARDALGIRAD